MCAKDGEVCDDRGCQDESLLAGWLLLPHRDCTVCMLPSMARCDCGRVQHQSGPAIHEDTLQSTQLASTPPSSLLCAAAWRWGRVVLRSEVVSAVLGTAFAIMAVSVCWLLSARTRTQRDHSTALAAAHVRPAGCWPGLSHPGPPRHRTETARQIQDPAHSSGPRLAKEPYPLLASVLPAAEATSALPARHFSHIRLYAA